MRLLVCRTLACLTLLLCFLSAVPAGAGTPPKATVPAGDTSLDQFIANAKRSAENGGSELKALVAQLDPLKEKRKTFLATRRAREAELARLQSAGADAQRTAALRKEVDAVSSQLNIVDTQFQVLIHRIQNLQNSGKAPPLLVPGGKAPTTLTGPTPARLTRTVPPDRIKAAASELVRNPAPSAAAARTAATQLLAASQPGYTSLDVDRLAQLVLQLASQENEADLRAALKAAQAANEPKTDKIEFKLAPANERSRIQEMQARQIKLEKVLIELSQKPAVPPARKPEK